MPMIKFKMKDLILAKRSLSGDLSDAESAISGLSKDIKSLESVLGNVNSNDLKQYIKDENSFDSDLLKKNLVMKVLKFMSLIKDVENFRKKVQEFKIELNSIDETIKMNILLKKLNRKNVNSKKILDSYFEMLHKEVLIDKEITLRAMNYDEVDKLMNKIFI